ncbi:MAG: septum formation initiator family protein [Desulfovibrio sp.]|nr:septum formation initiator family protein [Desulfovibrio sp.]
MLMRVILFVTLGLINVTLFFLMVWGQNGLMTLRELKSQRHSLEEQLGELENRGMQLSQEIRLLKTDKDYQERMIRQRLRYIRDNEIVYIFDS